MNSFLNFLTILILVFNIYKSFQRSQAIICKKPNEFQSIIAPPGVGKSCYAARIVRENLLIGRKTYSTTPIRGAIQIKIDDLGKYDLHDCDILIDEAGTVLNNRNWHSNADDKCVEFIKKHRHYNVNIYCFSQAPNDFDNKFRDLVTRVYLLNKSKIPFFVYAQAIKKVMRLESGQIVSYLEEEKSESFKFFIPTTWAYFDSWERRKDLKHMKEHVYTLIDLK